ncbi:MAG: PQQ-dependent sugar dehydrogenase [Gammaproteobacteria bacterium]|jgi:glucose/arabinose dehydrogenase|nr:PQQ-dependent sugar dehydrogenase [Gammaproteobacteria bacterium]MBT3858455.1 PQQ-dependent sugar dehydrogenase [Gammaproteobacteria bacterium]MBT3986807.1 PQQ-dependent sugar dehydrogenase [Gammaproteobacteria bacterium]MBT4582030.1 PQQ-dependent sugar dehydrogenase [Gammaproteobacteria bacterium]MBT4657626.1 PQQ-dependent sugar dehydrogenase [Gammaproteobacteria bacterium]
MLRYLIKLVGTGLLVSAATAASAQSDVYHASHDYTVETVAEGLLQPWSMAWLPGGDMLVTEKPGRLRIVRDGQLLPEAVPGVPEVFYTGQGGLFEVLPHPNFRENRWIYLSYAKELGDTSVTAVARGRLENDRLTNVVEIFIPEAAGFGHYGGKMVFDNDGYLFVTLGERQAPARGDLAAHPAQDLTNHHGVIVRLNDDGSVPDDNPFVGRDDALPEIWTYGHRSPQGLVIHPETGDLWESEHGPQGGDEINLIEPGNNYGWPVIGRGVNYGSIGSPIHAAIGDGNMSSPTHFWVPSIATSGLMVYTGDKFPLWFGSIISGALAGEQMALLHMNDDYRSVLREETLAYGLGRIREVRQGPDGYIYLAISDGNGAGRGDFEATAIMRLEPAD